MTLNLLQVEEENKTGEEADSNPRNYLLHTMKNLPQFRDRSHEEVRQYILETKGVYIWSNFNFGDLML